MNDAISAAGGRLKQSEVSSLQPYPLLYSSLQCTLNLFLVQLKSIFRTVTYEQKTSHRLISLLADFVQEETLITIR